MVCPLREVSHLMHGGAYEGSCLRVMHGGAFEGSFLRVLFYDTWALLSEVFYA